MGAPVVALVMVSSNSFHSFESIFLRNEGQNTSFRMIRGQLLGVGAPTTIEPETHGGNQASSLPGAPERFPAVFSARYWWIACEEVGGKCPWRTPPSTDEFPNGLFGVSAFGAPTTDNPETHGGNPASCLPGATRTIPSGIQCSILAHGL